MNKTEKLCNQDYYFIEPDNIGDIVSYTENTNKLTSKIFKKLITKQFIKKQPIIILISGTSIVGKSSIAIELSKLLGIRPVISTDIIRIILESECPKYRDILSCRSFQCWKIVSDTYSPESLIKGFEKQCDIIVHAIETLFDNSIINVHNTIIEGIHLTPKIVRHLIKTSKAYVVPLFFITSKERLKNILLPNRTKSTYMHRSINGYKNRLNIFNEFIDWWVNEIQKNDFEYIKNDCKANIFLEKIMKYLVEKYT